MNYEELYNNTNLQNVLWHTGIMQYPSPVVTLVDPWTSCHVILTAKDFYLTDAGTPALTREAYAKAESRGIPAENLQRVLGIILNPEDYRSPGNSGDNIDVDGKNTLGSFLDAVSEQAKEDLSYKGTYSGPLPRRISL